MLTLIDEHLHEAAGSTGIDTEDGDLMQAYIAGDATAFEQLHSRYHNSLYQFMMNSCGNEALAKELYQDVWLRVIKGRNTFKASSPFRAWLFRIARNHVVDHYRQSGRMPDTSGTWDEQTASVSNMRAEPLSPAEFADLSQQTEALSRAVGKLPPAQREVVLLRHIAGMSVSEIANVVDEGTETIKSRLRYAIAKLRSHLQELA